MKKNKIIIPAMAMILFSTAASISGTVAWFTANRVFNTKVGNFSVVDTEGNLKCVMDGGEGTIKVADNSIKVNTKADIDGILVAPKFFSQDAEPDSDLSENVLWSDTDDGNKVYRYTGTTWEEYPLKAGNYYKVTDVDKYYKATSETAWSEVDEPNPTVLTHGSINHETPDHATTDAKAYVIDPDSDTSAPTYFDKDEASVDNWIQQSGAVIKNVDMPPVDKTVDIYVAVSWKMTFTYDFGSDGKPVAVYLDLKESKFSDADPETGYDFRTSGVGNTRRGFRIGFYDAKYAVGTANAGSHAANSHDVVWGNNVPVMFVPAQWETGIKSEGTIVYYDEAVYKAKTDTSPDWVPAEWKKLYDLPDWSADTQYKAGDKVVDHSKVYQRKTTGTSGADFDATEAAEWDLLTIPAHATDQNYAIDDKVVYDNKIYVCKTPITDGGHPWEKDEWALSGDVKFASGYTEYKDDVVYTAGAIVNRGGMLYQRKVTGTPEAWNAEEWTAYESSDLRYVNSTSTTKFYDQEDYIYHDDFYTKVTSGTESSTVLTNVSRLCVLTSAQPSVTITCAAWYEGTDPNIISGNTMSCLDADMHFYSRSLTE